jgi:hypothetical protein
LNDKAAVQLPPQDIYIGIPAQVQEAAGNELPTPYFYISVLSGQ